MQIIPAIDLLQGRCVRLQQGDFEQETRYDTAPTALAQSYAEAGASLLHVVDLDGAREGTMVNREVIGRLARLTDLKIQSGGGLRCEEDVQVILDLGVNRAVIGSLAVREPNKVRDWIGKFGSERIVLALDVRWIDSEFRVAVSGWMETAEITLWDALSEYSSTDLKHVLCTDISRDGMLTGPNIQLYRELMDRMPGLQIQASGGVGNMAHLNQLRETGVPGVIVGKALLEGRLELDVLTPQRLSR